AQVIVRSRHRDPAARRGSPGKLGGRPTAQRLPQSAAAVGLHMMRRLIGQVHLWVGLSLCVPLVVLGLTGSVLVFEDELRTVFGPAAGHEAAVGVLRPAIEIVAAARAVAPTGFVALGYT